MFSLSESEVHIRPLTEADVVHAAAVVGKNYKPEYEVLSAAEMREMFGSGVARPTYLVAKFEDEVIGVTGYMQAPMDYDVYEIFWVNVSPEYQRRGIGQLLMRTAIKEIQALEGSSLIVLSTRSPKYYAKHFGFRSLGPFSKDSYLMSLSIES